METRLAPGEETLLHSHPIESAVIFLTDAQLRISNDDGSSSEEVISGGTVAFGDSAIVHRTANIGPSTARVVTVEIFSLQPPAANIEPSAAGQTLLENAKVRVARFQAMPHRHVSLEISTPAVIVAETAGVVSVDGDAMKVQPGDALWCEPGNIEFSTSVRSPCQVVVVMLKPRS